MPVCSRRGAASNKPRTSACLPRPLPSHLWASGSPLDPSQATSSGSGALRAGPSLTAVLPLAGHLPEQDRQPPPPIHRSRCRVTVISCAGLVLGRARAPHRSPLTSFSESRSWELTLCWGVGLVMAFAQGPGPVEMVTVQRWRSTRQRAARSWGTSLRPRWWGVCLGQWGPGRGRPGSEAGQEARATLERGLFSVRARALRFPHVQALTSRGCCGQGLALA